MYDSIIRNGLVVDGNGGAPYTADLGISNGLITDIGRVSGTAEQVIDADGRVVSPGFIDVHTHLDVQPFWDPTLSPSPLHGVTSVIGGNCGFSVAPIDDSAGPYLMRMLSRVEGMPLRALEEGVPWNWSTTAQFLDRLDGTTVINAGYLVGHSAIRRTVMGEAATERQATSDEVAAMATLLRGGLAAGAMGFSSTWSESHNDAEGKPVPSRWASRDELLALSAVTGEFPGTSLEFLPTVRPGPFADDVSQLMIDMSIAAQRPLNWNVLVVNRETTDTAYARLEVGDRATAAGGKVVALTLPDAPPAIMSFASGFTLDLVPGLDRFVFLPPEERLAILRDPERRRQLRRETEMPNDYKHLTDWSSRHLVETYHPSTQAHAGRVVGDIAEEQGCDSFDTFMDIVAADELRTTFTNPPWITNREDWEIRAKIWQDPRAVIGGSDAGAHLDQLSFFAYSTMLLENGVRRHGVISLQEAVRQLTSVQADLYGFVGRGRLEAGAVADITVVDIDAGALHPVRTRFDLPGGAGRLYAEADGVGHVLVSGTEVVRDGSYTGRSAGRILRSGKDTRTATLTL